MPTFLATSAATATYDYCTLAQVKARASIPSATTTHDTVIAAAITAASRVIDEDCQRIFYSVSATKYYTPDNALTLFVPDDVLTITTLTFHRQDQAQGSTGSRGQRRITILNLPTVRHTRGSWSTTPANTSSRRAVVAHW